MPTGTSTFSTHIEQYAMATAQAAVFLDTTPETLRLWRYAGEGPRYAQLGATGSRIFYRVDDLREWMDTSQNTPLSDTSTSAHVGGGYYLNRAAAAAFIGRSVRTLDGWRLGRDGGRGPRFIQHDNRSIQYRVVDLREWVDSGLIETHVAPTKRDLGPALITVTVTVLAPTAPHALNGRGRANG